MVAAKESYRESPRQEQVTWALGTKLGPLKEQCMRLTREHHFSPEFNFF